MNASGDFIYSGVHQRRGCFLHSGKIIAPRRLSRPENNTIVLGVKGQWLWAEMEECYRDCLQLQKPLSRIWSLSQQMLLAVWFCEFTICCLLAPKAALINMFILKVQFTQKFKISSLSTLPPCQWKVGLSFFARKMFKKKHSIKT